MSLEYCRCHVPELKDDQIEYIGYDKGFFKN
jgi:hypothetical protein